MSQLLAKSVTEYLGKHLAVAGLENHLYDKFKNLLFINLCVLALQELAALFGMTYQVLNVWILFIIGYCFWTGCNSADQLNTTYTHA